MKWLNSLLKESPPADPAAGPVAAGPPNFAEPAPSPDINAITSSGLSASPEIPSNGSPETIPADSLPSATPAAETAPAASIPFADLLQAATDPLRARQEELKALFETRLRSDEVQAKALEKLHDELRQYKTNFIRQQMLPLLKEVIFCHDFAAREFDRLSVSQREGEAPAEPQAMVDSPPSTARQEPRPPEALKSLAMLKQMLLDLLFKYDVEPFRSESDSFDPKTQQCSRTVPTAEQSNDKKIAETLLDGFQSPDGIVRRQQVTVFKFAPGAN